MSVAFARRLADGPAMRHPVHLALILCLALTGIGLGAARGTVVRAERVVLCTGHGVVVVDHPDAPRSAQICPDMALALLAAVPDAPLDGPIMRSPGTLARSVSALPLRDQQSPRPAARDPPVSRFSATTTV